MDSRHATTTTTTSGQKQQLDPNNNDNTTNDAIGNTLVEKNQNQGQCKSSYSSGAVISPRAQLTVVVCLLLITLNNDNLTNCDDYQGVYLGKFNSYSHQVNGDVYTVDEYTFLIKNFFYDGLSQDAFFWAGSSIRPSNKGFIIPSEDGRTNKLQRYTNRDITIKMPDDRKITSIKWLAIWDIRSSKNLGDIIVPEGFEPPTPKRISEFSRLSHEVRSESVTILNSRTITIQQLYYDGLSENAYFYAGIGPQPNPTGHKIPDETGALERLGAYNGEDIVLELPGNLTIFDIDWLSIYDIVLQDNFGSVTIPSQLSVPPALVSIVKYESRLPQCEQLHRNIQVNWEVFGPQITFELVAKIDSDDYIGFGISGADNSSQMIGSDVAISYIDRHLGYTFDYNITDRHPCVNLHNNEFKGVCPDVRTGGVENYQVHTFTREDGLTKITFRRNLINTGDEGDRLFKTTGSTYIVWAVGKLNKFKEPRYHHMYSKGNVKLDFVRKIAKNCFQFKVAQTSLNTNNNNDIGFTRQQIASLTGAPMIGSAAIGGGGGGAQSLLAGATSGAASGQEQQPGAVPTGAAPWGLLNVLNKTATTFYARLGHPGVTKGYLKMTGHGSAGLVWYINGLIAPILHVQRGKTYTFRVEGGQTFDQSYRFYHPLYITDDPYGGYYLQNVTQRRQQKIFAGIEFEPSKQHGPVGKPVPTGVGRLCSWLPNNINDIRKADTHQSFAQFRSSLNYTCLAGQAGILQWTPNVSTPDVVYYQSWTQRNMGWKILVSDEQPANN